MNKPKFYLAKYDTMVTLTIEGWLGDDSRPELCNDRIRDLYIRQTTFLPSGYKWLFNRQVKHTEKVLLKGFQKEIQVRKLIQEFNQKLLTL